LRTLVPDSPDYKRKCKGNAYQRDLATHQGTIAVWLLQFYAAGHLDVYGKQCKSHIESIYAEFENALIDRCVGSIGEYYDADPPHYTRGAISQATSVAALLWIQNELKSLNLKSKISIL
jgi:glycogen debranching enzyme